VDGVRGVAALLVLSYHVTGETKINLRHGRAYELMTHLDIGVALFFLISGFLLYRPFLSARTLGTPRPTFRLFMRRRLLRIVPAYWFALTVLLVWPGLSQVT
jgi:peptidoglycan/LPS O-acetylase OafA/YrhL